MEIILVAIVSCLVSAAVTQFLINRSRKRAIRQTHIIAFKNEVESVKAFFEAFRKSGR